MAILPGDHAIQPWEVLESDLMCAGVTFMAHRDNPLLAVDKAFKFPFTFPIPSKQANGVTRELLHLYA